MKIPCLAPQFASFRQQSKRTDWSLRLPSGKLMPVHSLVLSAASSVFDTAMSETFAESKDKILDVYYADSTAELGVAYIYGEDVQAPEDVGEQVALLQFANYYALEELATALDTALAATVKGTASAMALLPKLPTCATTAVDRCIQRIGKAFAHMYLSPFHSFDILAIPIDALELLLQSDAITAREAILLLYVVAWCEKHAELGAEVHARAARHVRLGLLTKEELERLVKKRDALFSQEACENALEFANCKDKKQHPLYGTVQSRPRTSTPAYDFWAAELTYEDSVKEYDFVLWRAPGGGGLQWSKECVKGVLQCMMMPYEPETLGAHLHLLPATKHVPPRLAFAVSFDRFRWSNDETPDSDDDSPVAARGYLAFLNDDTLTVRYSVYVCNFADVKAWTFPGQSVEREVEHLGDNYWQMEYIEPKKVRQAELLEVAEQSVEKWVWEECTLEG